ncbi:MAG: 3-isopropylmalate dehydratase large subunit [Methanocellales archaeon]|nr:3-isopropylmalate dehydratase large subunit [Methanocellales archaeon]
MSGQTISEKIFSRAANKVIHAGEFAFASVDCAMANDITAPLAVQGFNEILAGQKEKKVWDPKKVVIVFDHQAPADSLNAANIHIMLRKFAKEQNIINYDVCEGICHQIMVEKGHVKPGELIVGADSHTCTYGALGAFATGIGSTDMASVLATGRLWFKAPQSIRFEISGRLPDRVCAKDVILHIIGDVGADGASYQACEYAGPTVKDMDISERMTLCNMAIEMGAKAGIVEPDKKTETYLKERISGFNFGPFRSDGDANYIQRREYDVSELEPQVACPHNVDNVKSVSKVEGTKIDQIFIGSCTNGRVDDLKVVADILEGNKIAEGVRVIIILASKDEYMKALKAGFIETFIGAGAAVGAPCCGPCMGGSFGLLGDGEVGLATSNRNFKGRQGSTKAFVYLCSPATAAASALRGKITDPRTI